MSRCVDCDVNIIEALVGSGTQCVECFLAGNPDLGSVIIQGWRYRLVPGHGVIEEELAP